MQQADIDRTINLMFKHSDLMLRSTTVLTDTLYGLLNYLNSGREGKILEKHLQAGGKFEFVMVENSGAPEIEARMKQAGIAYVSSGISTMEGKKLFLYADKDTSEVRRIVNEYRCTHNKGGLHSKDLVYTYSKGSIRKIKDLDRYDATLMIEKAKQKGIFVSLETPDKDSYNIIYSESDKKVMDNIKLTLAIEKTYPAAFKAIKDQLDYEAKNKCNLMKIAIEHKQNDPLYFADLAGNYMIVSADKVTYHEYGGAESVIDYGDFDRESRISGLVSGMEQPTQLNHSQFQQYVQSGLLEKKDIICRGASGRPVPTHEQLLDLRKMDDDRILYERKLAQDNPEMEIYQYSYTNNEMRMGTFEDLEQINTDAIHDRKELRETNDPILYDDARSMYRGFRDESMYVDLEEEQFADAVMEGRVEEIERLNDEFSRDDLVSEMMNDQNSNLIPDDRESSQ